jgi:hypothetical protein
MSRPIVQRKGKTITRYSIASQRECSRIFVTSAYSIQDFCPAAPLSSCGNYSNGTILDGGTPSSTAICILDGGTPSQTSSIILVGGSP